MDDYYSYRPRVKLDAPVALVGFPGCRPLQTARVAAMLTGLETVMLPHQVTHHLDRHPEALLLKGQLDVLGAAELHLLQRTEKKRRHPILALGPTTLEDPACRAWITERCTVVHLRQTLREAVAAIEEEIAADARKHQHLRTYGGFDEESLASIYSLRTGLFERLADVEVAVQGRTALDVGRELPDVLGWVVD
jgi:shikimate kinase